MKSEILEFEVIDMLTTLVEEKDTYTGGHSKRVAIYALKIAKALQLSSQQIQDAYYCGLLHDVGKMLTPDTILLKPSRFLPSEFDIIKKHSEDSEKIIKHFTGFIRYRKTVRHHHERYDGKGYPDGISKENIPFLSRILAVADAFDAMTTNRIYKRKKDIFEAIDELHEHSGTQFDPKIVAVATEVFQNHEASLEYEQKPMGAFDEQRYAYFFKDGLTSVYSSRYLNYFLQENLTSKSFKCCYFIQLHNMHRYNKKHGWVAGNEALIEFALRIQSLFKSSFIFRIFGDDFVVLNKEHVEIESEASKKLVASFDIPPASIRHFDLYEEQISNWEELEKFMEQSRETT